jgi:hypothetical protein
MLFNVFLLSFVTFLLDARIYLNDDICVDVSELSVVHVMSWSTSLFLSMLKLLMDSWFGQMIGPFMVIGNVSHR